MDERVLYSIKSVIMGHAVADALGVPVEFQSRESLAASPVVGMRGYGTHGQPEGTWSDDTSMTVAALDALCEYGLDYGSVMDNFAVWYSDAEYTATGVTFDIGGTCYGAIQNYINGGKKPLESGRSDRYSNGNGSLMRILPFVLFGVYGGFIGDKHQMIYDASAITHGHRISKIGCDIYASVTEALLSSPAKESVISALRECAQRYGGDTPEYARLFCDGFFKTSVDSIQSSGYIVHTLEAAIWCLLNTGSYRECVLAAVNLGDDTDTVAAVAGGLAGALYGYGDIPSEWLDTLGRRDYLEDLCRKAAQKWSGR
ncbi:MAG: ADP-ribosylglycohydrolase family protein [Clostridia bacterium]|nr:ADP-ribosylglycohydrolase family protein [Clostridia bacterium]